MNQNIIDDSTIDSLNGLIQTLSKLSNELLDNQKKLLEAVKVNGTSDFSALPAPAMPVDDSSSRRRKRRIKVTGDLINRMRRDWLEGLSGPAIADKYGTSIATVYKHCRLPIEKKREPVDHSKDRVLRRPAGGVWNARA